MKVALLVLILAVAALCSAQAVSTVSIDAQNMLLSKVIDSLSTQSGVLIVVDEGIKGSVTATLTSVELEQAIDVIAKSQNLKWRKLYAKPGLDGTIPSTVARAQADALMALSETTVIVYDPTTKSRTVYMRVNQENTDSTMPEVNPEKMGLKPFYVVFKEKAVEEVKTPAKASDKSAKSDNVARDAKTDPGNAGVDKPGDVPKGYLGLNEQRLDSLARMTPDERKLATRAEAQWMLSLPPDLQTQLIKDFFGSADQLDPKARAQWKQMVKKSFGVSNTRRQPKKK